MPEPAQQASEPVAPGDRQASAGVRIPFPPDTRERVNPTTVYPFEYIGQIAATYPSGETWVGTGTLIDQYRVLTCAHNLFSEEDGGNATSVTFACAQNGDQKPYGEIAAQSWHVPEEYSTTPPPNPNANNGLADYTSYIWDYGLVVLSRPIELDLSPALYPATDEMLQSKTVGVWGYPDDKPPDEMWGTTGELSDAAAEFLFYRLATKNGQSGSAVLAYYDNLPGPDVPRVVGIHVAGDPNYGTNFAVRVSLDIINWVEA